MKRKFDKTCAGPEASGTCPKKSLHTFEDASEIRARFQEGLFEETTTNAYAFNYAHSEPYKHAVVSNLIDDDLLRSVRTEIRENVHFSPKETDIYKIHQSGDLANLDGLPASALENLPNLLRLRDALYSPLFREWVSKVSGAGSLSGGKTDMAVNVYVPGCHLLCHDDVIGSRRVSYILYLTDPDHPWQPEWGGALRLHSTDEHTVDEGKIVKVPRPEWSKAIPPAWNQLCFFAVQPGESLHDVEEVYRSGKRETPSGKQRVRMAISGWYHIPQDGEEDFEPGLEQKLAEKSSLHQLQGKADAFDEPHLVWSSPLPKGEQQSTADEATLSEAELDLLLRFMTPDYLTPDTVQELSGMFEDESTLQLEKFLNQKFAARLKTWLEDEDQVKHQALKFRMSRPPHKHRYQWISSPPASENLNDESLNPFELILSVFFPSLAFHKWLRLVTGLTLMESACLARRFRRGVDYQLAQNFAGEHPRLEYCLCITPTVGWSGSEGEAQDGTEEDNVGGFELYMTGDDLDDVEDQSQDDVEVLSSAVTTKSHTGAGNRRNTKGKTHDPAVYTANDEDDGILLSSPASWNTFSIVLRDRGTLRFVKYVSRSAPGDRWDFAGFVEVDPEEEDDGGIEGE